MHLLAFNNTEGFTQMSTLAQWLEQRTDPLGRWFDSGRSSDEYLDHLFLFQYVFNILIKT